MFKRMKNAYFKSLGAHSQIFEAQYLKTLRTQIEPFHSQLTQFRIVCDLILVT